ncbi:YihY/virulence factor BrkB family protein, partial [Herbaspirillum lusitanum]|uniref:YihY/virulence factor BrkB family protein n=1 Tax=Herbaspirillum lusitanum TaxID=213312 RepID=UPI0003785A5C
PAAAGKKTARPRSHTPSFIEQLAPVLTTVLPMIASWQAEQGKRAAHASLEKTRESAAPAAAAAALNAGSPQLHPSDGGIVKIQPGPWWRQTWQFINAAVNAWLDNFAPSMGAAIAYYTMFSIAPILIIAIAIAGMIFGQDAAQGEIVEQIRSIVGTEGAFAIQGLLKSVSQPREGMIAAGISVVTLVIGATAVFSELQSALDRIWRIPAVKRKSGVWQLARTRLLSFGLILGLGFMLMVSLVVSAGLAALGKWWGGWFEGWTIVMHVANFVISFAVFTVLFSAIYRFMPRVSLSWHDVRIGAMATTVMFMIGKYLIGLYLGRTGMSSGFGAAGSFALLLAWIYYSAQIFLLGAEFTWIYANNFGSRQPRI